MQNVSESTSDEVYLPRRLYSTIQYKAIQIHKEVNN